MERGEEGKKGRKGGDWKIVRIKGDERRLNIKELEKKRNEQGGDWVKNKGRFRKMNSEN